MGLRHALGVLGVLGWLAACSSSDPPKTSSLPPAELCHRRCALEVAAGCPKTPPDYQTSCEALCGAKYQKYPSCDAVMRDMDACAIDDVHYACSSTGTLSVTPQGACALQGLACENCTGDLLGCV